MKIPGFTAEMALYNTSEHYASSVVCFSSNTGQEIIPQTPDIKFHHWCRSGKCKKYIDGVDQYGDIYWKYARNVCCFLSGIPLGCTLVDC